MTREPLLQVVTVPLLDTNVTYCTSKVIPLQLANSGAVPVLIEDIAVHAQPEWESAAAAVTTRHTMHNLRVEPAAVAAVEIPFFASPLCRAATNYIDILVTYREVGSTISEPFSSVRQQACYLIISEPPPRRQQVFISYKEPEDLELAECLERIVRRYGFRAYRARSDIRPGTAIWKRKILPEIRASRAVAILWTRLTPLGSGVAREIKVAVRSKKDLIPLVEKDAPMPEYLRDRKDLERVTFDRATAPLAFAQAIAAVRSKKHK